MTQQKVRFLSNEYIEDWYQRTGECWQAGSMLAVFFGCFTMYLFSWAAKERMLRDNATQVAETFLGPIDGVIVYLLPLLFLGITLLLGLRSLRSYLNTAATHFQNTTDVPEFIAIIGKFTL